MRPFPAGAARDAAQLIATFPPEHVPRQVARLAARLDLDHATVTGAVVDALTRDADAPRRLARRDRRDDLGRGPTVTGPAVTPAQVARAGFPPALRAAPPYADTARVAATPTRPAPPPQQRAPGRSP